MKYPRYLFLLDSVGAIALVSTLSFVFASAELRPEEHVENLWGNLSTELIGMWVAVRFIDWSIKHHELFTKLRVRVVRNMRFVNGLFHSLHHFKTQLELRRVRRELDWGKKRLNTRKRSLSQDELHQVERFYALADDLVRLVESAPADLEQQTIEHRDNAEFLAKLDDLSVARQIAEDNILTETDEDEGLA